MYIIDQSFLFFNYNKFILNQNNEILFDGHAKKRQVAKEISKYWDENLRKTNTIA